MIKEKQTLFFGEIMHTQRKVLVKHQLYKGKKAVTVTVRLVEQDVSNTTREKKA